MLRDGLEHRLHIVGRAGDHLEDVGRRGLPLKCLPGLVEQPHIFDRDHRLVGEGLQQLDMMGGERAGLFRVALIMPIVFWRTSGTSKTLRKPRAQPCLPETLGTMGSLSMSGISTVSPLRILSVPGFPGQWLGNNAISAASADGLVGVKADRCNMSSTRLSTLVE